MACSPQFRKPLDQREHPSSIKYRHPVLYKHHYLIFSITSTSHSSPPSIPQLLSPRMIDTLCTLYPQLPICVILSFSSAPLTVSLERLCSAHLPNDTVGGVLERLLSTTNFFLELQDEPYNNTRRTRKFVVRLI